MVFWSEIWEVRERVWDSRERIFIVVSSFWVRWAEEIFEESSEIFWVWKVDSSRRRELVDSRWVMVSFRSRSVRSSFFWAMCEARSDWSYSSILIVDSSRVLVSWINCACILSRFS